MKKLLTLAFCCFIAVPALSDSSVKLRSGDASILEKAVEAFVVFDYSEAEIDEKNIPIEDYIDQKGYKFESKWETAQTLAHKDFIKQFNKKSPGLTLTSDSSGESELKFHILVSSINLGNTAKSLIPFGAKTDGGVTLNGKIFITDKTGKELCVLSFSDIQGLGSASIDRRLLLAYQALRSALIKFTKKKSKSTIEDDEVEEKTVEKTVKGKTEYSEDECID